MELLPVLIPLLCVLCTVAGTFGGVWLGQKLERRKLEVAIVTEELKAATELWKALGGNFATHLWSVRVARRRGELAQRDPRFDEFCRRGMPSVVDQLERAIQSKSEPGMEAVVSTRKNFRDLATAPAAPEELGKLLDQFEVTPWSE